MICAVDLAQGWHTLRGMADERPNVLSVPNVRRFCLFRIFFNARYYYPVYTVLFLDYGLTLDQFAILNGIWAFVIVTMEIPSGALADVVGRRALVRAAAVLMALELLLLVFVPLGASPLLFTVFLFNRIFSGMAEAAASGADEALAYDSLKDAGMEEHWPRVMEHLGKLSSVGFFVAMLLGGLVYDPSVVGRFTAWLGFGGEVTQDDTVRWPIYLTLVHAFIALWTAWGMEEPRSEEHRGWRVFGQAFRNTLAAGKWIVATPFVFAVIVLGMTLDSVARQFATLSTEYYRIIEYPEWSFGIIGSSLALVGLVTAPIARRMAENLHPLTNYLLIAVVLFTGLVGTSFAIPYWGLAMGILVFAMMNPVGLLVSHSINRETSSERRATVLSFRGLTFNLGYGAVSLIYGGIVSYIAPQPEAKDLDGEALGTYKFVEALGWLPGIFLAMVAIFGLVAWINHARRTA